MRWLKKITNIRYVFARHPLHSAEMRFIEAQYWAIHCNALQYKVEKLPLVDLQNSVLYWSKF